MCDKKAPHKAGLSLPVISLFCPAHHIIPVLNFQRLLGKHQRAESIHHYGQFFCFPGTNTFFHGSGVRPVRNTGGMQRDHSTGNMFAAHKIAIHIIQHFITVDITVIIRCRNCIGMIIVQPRHKTANHKGVGFKSLVHRRRLMHPPCYRFKIMYRKNVGITAAVPPNYIKGMCAIMQAV